MFESYDERIVQLMLELNAGRMSAQKYEKFILRVGSLPIIFMVVCLVSFQPDFIIPEWFAPASAVTILLAAGTIFWAGFGAIVQLRNIARSFPVEAEEYMRRKPVEW